MDGDWIILSIKNTANEAINITVLDLESSFEITQIYASGSGDFETLDAGQCRITAPPCRRANEMDAMDYRQG